MPAVLPISPAAATGFISRPVLAIVGSLALLAVLVF